jgi:hypothetical protein
MSTKKENSMTQSSATPTKKLNQLARQELDELVQLRDEIRLKVHNAGMEARSTWTDLEKQLEQLEERFGHQGDQVVETTRQIAQELRTAFRNFKNSLI